MLVSVVMSVYNGEKFLKEAIDSILNQTLTEFEFIIINDGSTDKSKNIIETYNDKRIIHIEQGNKGLSKALNIAISKCKGKYIARFDQDDICIPNRLHEQFNFLELNNDISVLSGAVYYVNESGNYLGRSFPITKTTLIKKKLMYSGCIINHPSVMMRKNDLNTVGGYSEVIGDRFTDYHLWLKFNNKGFKIKNLSTVFLKYRINQNSITSEFFIDSSGIKVLLNIVKKEQITLNDANLLKNICIPAIDYFDNREKAYKNLPNYLHNVLFFIGEKNKGSLLSGLNNIWQFFI